jgi:hypothetical protein
MLPKGLGPERSARVSALVDECRAALAGGTGMEEIQRRLAAKGLGVMDAILVTRELLGAGPDDLGRAKTIVFDGAAREKEREAHQRLIDTVLEALEAESAAEGRGLGRDRRRSERYPRGASGEPLD